MPAPPWFPFYHGDWIRSVSHLPLDVQGAYLRLLCHQWEHGGLNLINHKIDIDQVGRICGVGRQRAIAIWQHLAPKFCGKNMRTSEHTAINEKLESIRAKSETFFRSQATKAKRGAEARWKKAPGDTSGDATGHARGDAPSNAPMMPLPQPQSEDLCTGTKQRASTSPPQKPGSREAARALTLIQPRDLTAFYEGPIFNIPKKWASKVLKAANGALSESDLLKFAKALTAKVERTGHDVSAEANFLQYLDTELRLFRDEKTSDGLAEKIIAESEARRRELLK